MSRCVHHRLKCAACELVAYEVEIAEELEEIVGPSEPTAAESGGVGNWRLTVLNEAAGVHRLPQVGAA